MGTEFISPVIYGFSGTELTEAERDFFIKSRPVGFILFQRNCDNKSQLKNLILSLHEITENRPILILIDQEGGKVSRLSSPSWKEFLPASRFTRLAKEQSEEIAAHAVYLNHLLIGLQLAELGINVDCAPVVDIEASDSSDVLTERCFGNEAGLVSCLAAKAAEGLMAGGVLPVIKHIPGHGRATVDSHHELPIIDSDIAELEKSDFIPFKELSNLPMAMTAHIVYKSIDDKYPVSISKKAVDLIRDKIGFKGLLMSDDISMKAISGDIGENSALAISVGCDIVLHCNGNYDEMQKIQNSLNNSHSSLSEPASRKLDSIFSKLEDITITQSKIAEMRENIVSELQRILPDFTY